MPRAVVFEGVQTARRPRRSIAQILEERGPPLPRAGARPAARACSTTSPRVRTCHQDACRPRPGRQAHRPDPHRSLEQRDPAAEERSDIESTDVTEAITLIKAKLTSLEAAQTIFGRSIARPCWMFFGNPAGA
jgi:hypothetical protein